MEDGRHWNEIKKRSIKIKEVLRIKFIRRTKWKKTYWSKDSRSRNIKAIIVSWYWKGKKNQISCRIGTRLKWKVYSAYKKPWIKRIEIITRITSEITKFRETTHD